MPVEKGRKGRRWLWVAVFLLAACSRPDAEQRLRSQLQDMQAAAADSRISAFMEGVSDDFTGNDGADRAALHNLLRMQVLGKTSVGVVTGPFEVELRDATATVRFTAVVSGGTGRFLPDNAQAYSITSGWREEGGDWKVYYAEWKPQL